MPRMPRVWWRCCFLHAFNNNYFLKAPMCEPWKIVNIEMFKQLRVCFANYIQEMTIHLKFTNMKRNFQHFQRWTMEHNWFILGDFETLGSFRWWENHHDGWSHSKKPCDRCGDIFEQQFSPRAGARVTPHIEEPQLFRCVAPRVVEIFLRGQRECCKYQNLRFGF